MYDEEEAVILAARRLVACTARTNPISRAKRAEELRKAVKAYEKWMKLRRLKPPRVNPG